MFGSKKRSKSMFNTSGENIPETAFLVLMDEIIQSIREAGYEPYDQLYGYITNGKEEYITRKGNAREKVKALNWLLVKEYVERMK